MMVWALTARWRPLQVPGQSEQAPAFSRGERTVTAARAMEDWLSMKPNCADVFDAKRRIGRYLARTPMYSYPALNDLIGAEVFVKHENYQPVGAFKVRGGVNLIS